MYELVGYRYVDIVGERKNDRDLKGWSCHFLMDERDEEFTGRSGVKVFFSSDIFPDFQPRIGDKYLLIFNQKGKLQGFQKLDG